MKCPKCNYIGFEPTDRCRNCGYDFSLTAADPSLDPDLPMRSPQEPMGPLADFDLGDARRAPRATPNTRAARRRPDAPLDPGVPSNSVTPADLPLFGELPPGDAPLVRPAAASAPLSVRRSTPAPTRLRTPLPSRTPERAPEIALPLETATDAGPEAPPPAAAPGDDVADLGPRCGAAAVDWVILLALDAAIVYFTLRASRLTAGEVWVLPIVPLAAFLLMLNGGYLVLFTAASGQTIGKMAFGLKVVSGSDEPVTIGRALVRVVAFLLGAAAAGLGLLPVAFDRWRRGLHDRLADTRVVRAHFS